MVKKELARLYAEKEGIYNVEAQRRIDSLIELMKTVLKKDGSIVFRGFGSFEVKKTTRKTGINPRTGEEIKLTPRKIVKFRSSKHLF